jgi:hypothetical protein
VSIVATAVGTPDGAIYAAPDKIHLQIYEAAGVDPRNHAVMTQAMRCEAADS